MNPVEPAALFDADIFAGYFDDDVDNKEDDLIEGQQDAVQVDTEFSWDNDANADESVKKIAFETQNRSVMILIDVSDACHVLWSDFMDSALELVKGIALEMTLYGRNDRMGVSLFHDNGSLDEIHDLVPFQSLNATVLQSIHQFTTLNAAERWSKIKPGTAIEKALDCQCHGRKSVSEGQDLGDYISDALFHAGQAFQEIGKAKCSSNRVVIITHNDLRQINNATDGNENDALEGPISIVKSLRELGTSFCLIPLSINMKDNALLKVIAPSSAVVHTSEFMSSFEPSHWTNVLSCRVPRYRLDSKQGYSRLEQYLMMSRKKLLFHGWLSLPDSDIHIPVAAAPVVSATARYPSPYYIDIKENKPCRSVLESTDLATGSVVLPIEQTRALKLPGLGSHDSLKVEFTTAMRQSLRLADVAKLPPALLQTNRTMPPVTNRIIILAKMTLYESSHLMTIGTALAFGATEHLARGASRVFCALVDGLRADDSVAIGVLLRGRTDMRMVLIKPTPNTEPDAILVTHLPWSNELRAVKNPVADHYVPSPVINSVVDLWDTMLTTEVPLLSRSNERDIDAPLLPNMPDPARKNFKDLMEILTGTKEQAGINMSSNTSDPHTDGQEESLLKSIELHRELFRGANKRPANGNPVGDAGSTERADADDLIHVKYRIGKLASLTVPVLKRFCLSHSITIGKKADLIARIEAFIASSMT